MKMFVGSCGNKMDVISVELQPSSEKSMFHPQHKDIQFTVRQEEVRKCREVVMRRRRECLLKNQ